jgi:hypothetical protein
MAKIDRENSRLTAGMLQALSGEGRLIEFVRTGVIRTIKEPIRIKRPNQYK